MASNGDFGYLRTKTYSCPVDFSLIGSRSIGSVRGSDMTFEEYVSEMSFSDPPETPGEFCDMLRSRIAFGLEKLQINIECGFFRLEDMARYKESSVPMGNAIRLIESVYSDNVEL